jgi:hypothetical protein
MAQMLSRRDSTAKHLNAAWRYMRLCNRDLGTEKYAVAIQPQYEALLKANALVKEKELAREVAYDYVTLADHRVDKKVKVVFGRCEVYDGENPGSAILPQIFPDKRFGDIVGAPILKPRSWAQPTRYTPAPLN